MTPSRGLEVAAEYIASEFRRIGLEPAGDDGYFQTAAMQMIEEDFTGFELTVSAGDRRISVGKEDVGLQLAELKGLELQDIPLVKLDGSDPSSMRPEDIQGKALLVERRGRRRTAAALRDLKPALIVFDVTDAAEMERLRGPQLADASAPPSNRPPRLFVRNADFRDLAERIKPGSGDGRISVHLAPPRAKPLRLRNVAGLLRGSDPVLRDSYVLVTAHYDHIGVKASGEGDRIYNGANDDGSGTVSVIEIAAALAGMRPAPRRSILFLTFFGEEIGGLGARYYTRHPLEPLAKTIADVNLEQLGRTDATDGTEVGTASFTGFDYSGLPAIFQAAGELTGVKVYKDSGASDAYFSRSDNQELADAGIPAHTLCVAFDFPDYHGVGDHWDKIDYANMAKIDRMVGAGLLMLAGDAPPPQWNQDNPRASRYLEAWKKLHANP